MVSGLGTAIGFQREGWRFGVQLWAMGDCRRGKGEAIGDAEMGIDSVGVVYVLAGSGTDFYPRSAQVHWEDFVDSVEFG